MPNASDSPKRLLSKPLLAKATFPHLTPTRNFFGNCLNGYEQ